MVAKEKAPQKQGREEAEDKTERLKGKAETAAEKATEGPQRQLH